MVLTAKQQADLNRSILAYFHTNQYTDAYNALASACNIHLTDTELTQQKDSLTTKWTSVIRLQKRIIDLESQLSNTTNGHARNDTPALPYMPVRYTLTGHRASVNALAFHPHYNTIYTCSSDATVRQYDCTTGVLMGVYNSHTDAVNDIDVSADGKLLISCSADSTVKLYTITSTTTTCTKTMFGHDAAVSAVRFSYGSDIAYSTSKDCTIRVWNVATAQCTRTIPIESWLRHIDISSDSQHIAGCGNDRNVYLYNVSTGACEMTLTGHEHVVECCAFSNATAESLITTMLAESNKPGTAPATNGVSSSKHNDISSKYIVTGGRDKCVKLWNAQTANCVRTLNAHDGWVKSDLFHTSGRYIITCGDDNTIRVFDITKQLKCVVTLDGVAGRTVTQLQYCSQMQLLAAACEDGSVQVYPCKPSGHHTSTASAGDA